MPTFRCRRFMPRPQLTSLLKTLKSSREPARVVTPGGVNPRGYPPAWKCVEPRFQSLVEEDCQRTLEIASLITEFVTHPITLELGTADEPCRYTPDLLVWSQEVGALFEAKSESKLAGPEIRARLTDVIRRLKKRDLHLVLMLDTDVREAGLQDELKQLQRLRPVRGRFRGDVDPNLWDPRQRCEPDDELLARWARAQRICDDLLKRVMRRDPEDLLPAIND